jgi:hypothetical protein
MRLLTTGMPGEVFSEAAYRLVRYGLNEREAWTLARFCTLAMDATDAECEQAVINALVIAKTTVDRVTTVEYLGGRRCDVQRRLEGRE